MCCAATGSLVGPIPNLSTECGHQCIHFGGIFRMSSFGNLGWTRQQAAVIADQAQSFERSFYSRCNFLRTNSPEDCLTQRAYPYVIPEVVSYCLFDLSLVAYVVADLVLRDRKSTRLNSSHQLISY